MKNIGLIFFTAIVVFFTACQETVDPEAEKQAIIDVINAETDAYLDYDFEKVISFYVQDSLNIRLSAGADNHVYLEGWDQIEEFFRNDIIEGNMDALPNTHIHVEKNDYKIKLLEESAFVTCTETWTYTTDDNVIEINSRQVRFMQKIDGEWKIAFLSFIGTSGYEQEEELEELGAEFNSI